MVLFYNICRDATKALFLTIAPLAVGFVQTIQEAVVHETIFPRARYARFCENPSILRTWIKEQCVPLRAAIASNPKAPSEVLRFLFSLRGTKEESWAINNCLAENAALPYPLLESIGEVSESWSELMAFLANPRVHRSKYLLQSLVGRLSKREDRESFKEIIAEAKQHLGNLPAEEAGVEFSIAAD